MQDASIVLDNGSDSLKVGYSGEDGPRACFETVVSKLASPDLNEEDISMYLNGDVLLQDRSHVKLSHPIEYRTITHWQDMEYLWDSCYSKKLEINSEEYGILMTEPPSNPRPNREKMIHTMFEHFNVPAFYVANQMVLALYALGRTTGVVLDIGHNVTHAVPIYEGNMLPTCVTHVDFGGADITKHVQKLLKEENLDERTARDIKENYCYVPLSEGEPLASDQKYALPDGKGISISDRLAKCPDFLFHSFSSDRDGYAGIQDLVYKTIQRCDIDIRKDFYMNVVLSGGSALFKGIDDRLKSELDLLTPASLKPKVIKNDQGKFETWIGRSILSSLTTFQTMWVSRDEYEESGPSIVHRKCF